MAAIPEEDRLDLLKLLDLARYASNVEDRNAAYDSMQEILDQKVNGVLLMEDTVRLPDRYNPPDYKPGDIVTCIKGNAICQLAAGERYVIHSIMYENILGGYFVKVEGNGMLWLHTRFERSAL